MTDQELKTFYRMAPVKAVAAIQAARAEGVSLGTMAKRLHELGCEARIGLKRAFGTQAFDLVPELDIERYLRKYHWKPEPEKHEGVVTAYCDGCRYLSTDGMRSCEHFTRTGRRRGCPAGDGCTAKSTKRRRRHHAAAVEDKKALR